MTVATLPPTTHSTTTYEKSSSGQDKEAQQHKPICLSHGVQLTDIKLGCGSYSTVKFGVKISPNINIQSKKVAVKILSKTKALKEGNKSLLLNEVFNHRLVGKHQNVVSLFDVFETNNYLYLVLEYCPGGNLLDFINKYGKPGLREAQSRLMFSQICHAVSYCHENNIVHRDIKCENLLLDERLSVRLTDFGFSCTVKNNNQKDLAMFCGSPAYAAPEIIRGKPYNGKLADTWSVGIVLYCLVCGRLPFNLKNKTLLLHDMQYQRMRLTSLSSELILLLRHILQCDADRRPSLKSILENSWTQGRRRVRGTSMHQTEILNRRYKSKKILQLQRNAAASQSFISDTSSAKSKNSFIVVGDPCSPETILLRSRIPRKHGQYIQEEAIEKENEKNLKWEQEQNVKREDSESSSDEADRPPQNTPEDNTPEDNMPTHEVSENEQGDHQRQGDRRTAHHQCCVMCYRERVKQCLRRLEKLYTESASCDDQCAARLLRDSWNKQPDFGVMTEEQAMLIWLAWRQRLAREKQVPVFKFTKKSAVSPNTAPSKIIIPPPAFSVPSDNSICTTSTKVTLQSEQLPLDDLLLIKSVFGNRFGAPCNKRSHDTTKGPSAGSAQAKTRGHLRQPVSNTTKPVSYTTKPVSNTTKPVSYTTKPVSYTTRQASYATRPVSYTTNWEVRSPILIPPEKPSISSQFPSQFPVRGKIQRKINAFKPTVKQLVKSRASSNYHEEHPNLTSTQVRHEKMMRYPMQSRQHMTTKDLIAALGTSYPRQPKKIDINIKPWKP